MSLLAISFNVTTDVWYVRTGDTNRWCYGSRRSSPNRLKFEPLLVSGLEVGDFVSGSGWLSWPREPDGSPAAGLRETFEAMDPHMVYMVKSVEDGLAHQVLES